MPSACGEPGDKKVLLMTSKTRLTSRQGGQLLNESHQAFGNQFNTLYDQNYNLLRYEVRLNRDEFEYIKSRDFATNGKYSRSFSLRHKLEEASWQGFTVSKRSWI